MIKKIMILLLLVMPVVASASGNTRDKYPKVKKHSKGFNYKKHHRKVKKQKRKARNSQSCKEWFK